jgi:hypothetical protein
MLANGRGRRRALHIMLCTSAIFAGGYGTSAGAQTALKVDQDPFDQYDTNGVNLIAGTIIRPGPSLPATNSRIVADLEMQPYSVTTGIIQPSVYQGPPINNPNYEFSVSIGRNVEIFSGAELQAFVGTLQSTRNNGSTFSCLATGICTYVDKSGRIAKFDKNLDPGAQQIYTFSIPVISLSYPDGEVIKFDYTPFTGTNVLGTFTSKTLSSVRSNAGFQLKMSSSVDNYGNVEWNKLTLLNNAVDYCPESLSDCQTTTRQ